MPHRWFTSYWLSALDPRFLSTFPMRAAPSGVVRDLPDFLFYNSCKEMLSYPCKIILIEVHPIVTLLFKCARDILMVLVIMEAHLRRKEYEQLLKENVGRDIVTCLVFAEVIEKDIQVLPLNLIEC